MTPSNFRRLGPHSLCALAADHAVRLQSAPAPIPSLAPPVLSAVTALQSALSTRRAARLTHASAIAAHWDTRDSLLQVLHSLSTSSPYSLPDPDLAAHALTLANPIAHAKSAALSTSSSALTTSRAAYASAHATALDAHAALLRALTASWYQLRPLSTTPADFFPSALDIRVPDDPPLDP